MGKGFEVLAGRVTNPGATITALTANTGDSFQVKNFALADYAYLENLWAEEASAGVLRIISPRLHDNVQGLRFRAAANDPAPLIGYRPEQRLYAQDILSVALSGGGAETDNGFLLVYYPDLPGIDQQLMTWDETEPRIVNLLGQETQTTTSATAGDWSGGTAINATFDNLKANTFYAILGYEADTRLGAVAYRGPDVGNIRVGGPGSLTRLETREWFVNLSVMTGRPHIPVINSANKAATFLFVCDPAVSATVNVVANLAELRM